MNINYNMFFLMDERDSMPACYYLSDNGLMDINVTL